MSGERKNVYVCADIHKKAKRHALEHDEHLGEFVARAIKEAMQREPSTTKERQEDEGKQHEAERSRKSPSA